MEAITFKRKIRLLISIALLALVIEALFCLASTLAQGNISALDTGTVISSDSPSNKFSIIQITDTQNLAEFHPDLNYALTQWIVNNSATYNTKMVVHTGDLVNFADIANMNGTISSYGFMTNATAEWNVASNSIMTLFNNGIPYVWCAGNHDQLNIDNPDALNYGWYGSNFPAFNVTAMEAKSYWVSDLLQGRNTAAQFSYGNYKFLVIDMEFEANSSVIQWMTNLIETYSRQNYNIIVATHAQNNNIIMNGPKIATANWKTQYELFINSSYGSPLGQGWYDSGSTVSFEVTTPYFMGSGTQYVFLSWAGQGVSSYTGNKIYNTIVIKNPINETAEWKIQYYLTVYSTCGNPTGSNWYDSGSIVYANVSTGIISVDDFTRFAFKGWSGDASGTGVNKRWDSNEQRENCYSYLEDAILFEF